MSGYTKLFNSIVLSTVWREPNHVRIVWITLLALADADGYISASIPGLADAARVTIPECEQALSSFLQPDHYSRSKEYDGRRIEEVDGGWLLLNYNRYRNERDEEKRREQWRKSKQKERNSAKSAQVNTDTSVKVDRQQSPPRSAQAEAEAEANRELVPAVRAALVALKREGFAERTKKPLQLAIDLCAERADLDIAAAIGAAGRWCRSNPRKAPRSNIARFLLSWIRRENPDASRPEQPEGAQQTKTATVADVDRMLGLA